MVQVGLSQTEGCLMTSLLAKVEHLLHLDAANSKSASQSLHEPTIAGDAFQGTRSSNRELAQHREKRRFYGCEGFGKQEEATYCAHVGVEGFAHTRSRQMHKALQHKTLSNFQQQAETIARCTP